MKLLRRLCVALTLTLALAVVTFAGEIHTTVTPPPTNAATTEGEIETGLAGQIETPSNEAAVSDSAVNVALNLLQSVLALF